MGDHLDILSLRLQNHHLYQPDFETPEAVVSHYGAVQAQDYGAARWSVGQRMKHTTDAAVEKACDEGCILRTHIMRPTWHFVTPQDIRSFLKLTSPRVHSVNAYMGRKLELDTAVLARSQDIIAKALAGKYLTRTELAGILSDHGISATGLRATYIIMCAELEGIICNGPRRGKQFTYALLHERAPQKSEYDRDRTLADLTLRYFRSHGPAQLKDFSWWSGLLMRDAKEGIELVKAQLQHELVNDKTYYFVSSRSTQKRVAPRSLLLSIYDEYTIAYNDRSDLDSEKYYARLIAMGNALTGVMILDGRIVGTWKREIKKDKVLVLLSPFRPFNLSEQASFDNTLRAYSTFMQLPVTTEMRLSTL